ncbi:MAG: shikimate dehydrogenase [Oscillospiraceae bacterium]|jgi:shikimate dehydrogenase|nr:shikimate dehydrogenase [Oscillospiraceae bacterium]
MTSLYGLIGKKLGHSLSPKIHRFIAEKLNLELDYRLFEVAGENAGNIVAALKTLSITGANITIPYKTTVLSQLDELSPQAAAIGAVNTISINSGKATGYNTDYYGIEKTFEKLGFEPEGKFAVVLGNGGASKAVQACLIDKGIAELAVITRHDDWYPGYEHLARISEKDIIINATPVGMYPDEEKSPVSEEILQKFDYAFDLVFNPFSTLFTKRARNAGLRVENGLYMLIFQAIRAQEIWHNIKIGDAVGNLLYEQAKTWL